MRWSSRSGSNWLDRLRSTKGFSAAAGGDLDHFLSDTNTPIRDSDSAPPIQIGLPDQTQSSTAGEWYGVLSNVLSELFNMGDQTNLPRFPGKRIPRKQTNPRICSLPIGVGEEGASAASLGSGNNSVEVSIDADPPPPQEEEEEELDVDVDVDLVGYSRSEVTVIDTSFADWKFEKLVFRRKNVWKVRDKKGKPRSFVGRRKRKHGGGPEVGLENNKRLKLSDSHSQLQDTLKPSSEEHDPQNKRREETRIERPNDLAQVLDTRISFSGSPRKLGMKGVPRSKRSGLKFPKTGTRLPQNNVRLNEMAEARLVGE